jgi:hypothetical protein
MQSWGHTLTAAANLHVMLALGGRKYGSTLFEVAFPEETYAVGMIDVITHDAAGFVHAPNSAEGLPGGLGVRVDWEEMNRLAFFKKIVGVRQARDVHDADDTVGRRTIRSARL